MSYYWFNKQEILQKTKKKSILKKKLLNIICKIKKPRKKRQEIAIEEKEKKIKEYQKKNYQELI